MITKLLIDMVFALLQVVFGWFSLPDFPASFTSSINSFLDLLFSNLSLLGLFIRQNTITVIIPVLIGILAFEHIYEFVMWILRKIPFLSIK